jgi:hypothetical protein
MKKNLILLFASVTILAAVMPALAQFDEEKPSKFGIRVVLLTPMATELRKLNAVWFGPEFDYNLKFDKANRATSIITLGSVSSSDKHLKASIVPLSYTHITRKDENDKKTRYFGIGAGIDLVKINVLRTSPTGFPVLIHGKSYLPEAHFVYGEEFKNAYFVELQLSVTQTWQGDNWSSVSLNIGTHTTF